MPGISLGPLRWCACASTREFEQVNGHHTRAKRESLKKNLGLEASATRGNIREAGGLL